MKHLASLAASDAFFRTAGSWHVSTPEELVKDNVAAKSSAKVAASSSAEKDQWYLEKFV
eukprot:CAMPEP_0179449774 /NCGR_PEP_ID=MMETSP0799-20121207/33637_1 /TAXON_ID=46947 /ORGANISM="Geminigera cryophila, Strain CCMP2564" /LENGTH=58 /DNA_ID=CAMNT_0021242987 /DNA_START=120 /DNA_END=296 /DNA_ORIENTATION=-